MSVTILPYPYNISSLGSWGRKIDCSNAKLGVISDKQKLTNVYMSISSDKTHIEYNVTGNTTEIQYNDRIYTNVYTIQLYPDSIHYNRVDNQGEIVIILKKYDKILMIHAPVKFDVPYENQEKLSSCNDFFVELESQRKRSYDFVREPLSDVYVLDIIGDINSGAFYYYQDTSKNNVDVIVMDKTKHPYIHLSLKKEDLKKDCPNMRNVYNNGFFSDLGKQITYCDNNTKRQTAISNDNTIQTHYGERLYMSGNDEFIFPTNRNLDMSYVCTDIGDINSSHDDNSIINKYDYKEKIGLKLDNSWIYISALFFLILVPFMFMFLYVWNTTLNVNTSLSENYLKLVLFVLSISSMYILYSIWVTIM